MALEVSLVVFTAFIVQVQRTHLGYSEQFIVAVTYCHTSSTWQVLGCIIGEECTQMEIPMDPLPLRSVLSWQLSKS